MLKTEAERPRLSLHLSKYNIVGNHMSWLIYLCFNFRVLDVDKWDNGSLTYDVIGCLNLLDRCDKPVSILHSIKKTLRPGTGRVIVAVVLPFKPYVETGKKFKLISSLLTLTMLAEIL